MAVGLDSAYAWDWSSPGHQKCHGTVDPCGNVGVVCTPDNLGSGGPGGGNGAGGGLTGPIGAPVGPGGHTGCGGGNGGAGPHPESFSPGGCGSQLGPGTGNHLCNGAALGFGEMGSPLFRAWFNNQQSGSGNNMGPKWRTSYHMRLTFPSGTQVTFEDADGTPWSFTKNADGTYAPEAGYHATLTKVPFLGSYIYVLALTSARSFWFDINGRLMLIFEADGNAYDLVTYDNGRLSTVEVYIKNGQSYQATGRKLTFGYDASNRITSLTDPASRQAQFTYDANGHISAVTDPAGAVTGYSYDSNDRITAITRNGHTWSYGYDSNNFVSSVTDPLNHTTTYTYTTDSYGRISSCTITDPNQHATVHTFDSNGRLTRVTDALGHYRSFTHSLSLRAGSMTPTGTASP
jgi:YD repeat-containing protein